ncbi:MAG: hypothetical protein IPP48_05495 [Chitinophagaceae bacterium]|nr:hypothetical protein [Chitinophagaceae bacterium]
MLVHFMLKAKGMKVYYLGTAVPLKDIFYTVKAVKPDYLYSHLTSVSKNFKLDKFIEEITLQIPNVPLVVSGNVVSTYSKKLPKNIHKKNSLKEVIDFISAI